MSRWRTRALLATSYFSPPRWGCHGYSRPWCRPRDRLHRVREPLEEIPELKSLELERIAYGNLFKDVHIGPLNAHSKKCKGFACLTFANHGCRALPSISWSTISNEKNPWSIKGDTVCSILLFPLPHQIEPLLYGSTHGGISAGL